MFALLALLLCSLFVGGVAYLAWRARTLFELDFRGGKLAHARGRLPQTLLDDLLVAIPRSHQAPLIVRCVIEQNHPRLVIRGSLPEDNLQQLRNLVGLWPLARLRSARRIAINVHGFTGDR